MATRKRKGDSDGCGFIGSLVVLGLIWGFLCGGCDGAWTGAAIGLSVGSLVVGALILAAIVLITL